MGKEQKGGTDSSGIAFADDARNETKSTLEGHETRRHVVHRSKVSILSRRTQTSLASIAAQHVDPSRGKRRTLNILSKPAKSSSKLKRSLSNGISPISNPLTSKEPRTPRSERAVVQRWEGRGESRRV